MKSDANGGPAPPPSLSKSDRLLLSELANGAPRWELHPVQPRLRRLAR
jgi:hypothetical protein